jgi:hypothetical protein
MCEAKLRFWIRRRFALKDDCIGFTLARDFDLREIGLLYYVMACSQTLGDALKRIARYSKNCVQSSALAWINNNSV